LDVERRSALYESKTGGLLHDPDLTSVLRAQAEGQWSAAWARRYTRDPKNAQQEYGRVVEYIAKSKSLRAGQARVRRTLIVVAVLAAVTFAILGGVWKRASLRATEAERQVNGQKWRLEQQQSELEKKTAGLEQTTRELRSALSTANTRKLEA